MSEFPTGGSAGKQGSFETLVSEFRNLERTIDVDFLCKRGCSRKSSSVYCTPRGRSAVVAHEDGAVVDDGGRVLNDSIRVDVLARRNSRRRTIPVSHRLRV